MGLSDLFKKKSAKPDNGGISKEDIFREILAQQAPKSPSELFASGSVFDISRGKRDQFLQALRSNDAFALIKAFADSYAVFLDVPEVVNFSRNMVNKERNDTNPGTWNADMFKFGAGDYAALLFMPVEQSTVSARIVGIIFSDREDGYYYCMLSKDENAYSDVFRNRAMRGIHKTGAVKGLGFELMHSFLSCIREDFYGAAGKEGTQDTDKPVPKMYCIKCGKQLKLYARYCNYCGFRNDQAPIIGSQPGISSPSSRKFCSKCKNPIHVGSYYCKYCGEKFDGKQ